MKEDHYYEAPDGKKYKVGELVPLIRINGMALFNDMVVLATCDWCDWKVVGPTSMIGEMAQSHLSTHILNEEEDSFRHPDFTE